MKNIVIKNASIHTMNKKCKMADTMIIKNGKIFKIGKYEEIFEFISKESEIMDLEGKTIIPGFNDSHLHFLKGGQSINYLDLSKAKSIDEIIEFGKDYIKRNDIEKGTWVLGRGWDQLNFQFPIMPNRFDLDKISTEHPIAFTRSCEHAISTNTMAIKCADVSKKTIQPRGGEWCSDEKGIPNGIFKDTARDLIYAQIEEPNKEEIKNYLISAIETAISHGVTSVQTDDIWSIGSKNYNKIIKAYKELESEGKLKIRIYEQCVLEGKENLENFLKDGYKTGQGSDFFKIGPFKMFSDGAVGVRSACLFESYTDDLNNKGMLSFSEEEMKEMMSTAAEAGMQLTAHAIGDKAVDTCLNIYKEIQGKCKGNEERASIIHAHVFNKPLIKKFAENNVIMIGDPVALVDDIPMFRGRLGESREKYSYPYKSFLQMGGILGLATDWPISTICPMRNIYSAVERKNLTGKPLDGWLPQEKINVEEAVYAYTMGSAYCSFEEDIKGSLEEGKLADFLVLNQDIFSVASEEILETKVEKTFIGGRLVYAK